MYHVDWYRYANMDDAANFGRSAARTARLRAERELSAAA